MDAGATLVAFLALGLAGSLHCAGMCGGFALAVAAAGPERRRAVLARELAFVVGKALTYAMLGVALSLLGRGAAQWAGLDGWRRAAAWLTGLALVLAGLRLCGLSWSPPRSALGARARAGIARLAATWRSVLSLEGYAGPLGAGLLLGFLPCGLSWSALVLAATVAPPTAAVGAFLFGLATAPALLAVGLGWGLVRARARRIAALAVGPLLVAVGVVTVLRGGGPGTQVLADTVLPECCTDDVSER